MSGTKEIVLAWGRPGDVDVFYAAFGPEGVLPRLFPFEFIARAASIALFREWHRKHGRMTEAEAQLPSIVPYNEKVDGEWDWDVLEFDRSEFGKPVKPGFLITSPKGCYSFLYDSEAEAKEVIENLKSNQNSKGNDF